METKDEFKPEVKCEECGGEEFKLKFGDYCLLGKCVKCGAEKKVYES